MKEKINEILHKYSYTNEDGENVIGIHLFEDIIKDICKEVENN